MVDVLLFKSNDNILESENRRNERIDSFGETLNNAFKQFQKLWEDYKELLEKCKESKSSSSNIQNTAKDTNVKCCTCSAKTIEKVIPAKESVCISKETIVNCDPLTAAINEPKKTSDKPPNTQSFQIFSQDFCTQGLEESFVNQSKEPLQEIQNLTPERAKSPIFGSKKGKTRVTSSQIDSPNLSEKSVVILSGSEKSSKIDNRIIDCDLTNSLVNALSPVQVSSPGQDISSTPKSKKVRKWGISTIHNVNTDIIVGTKKKLKQSKLFVRTEKLTDLSNCDEVITSGSKFNDERSRDGINENYTQTNNNFLEDSVIQGSPEQEKSSSKIGQRITKRNKNVEKIQQGLIVDGNNVKDINLAAVVEVQESKDRDFGLMDTDVTIFDPRIASTQYSVLPCYSKSLMIDKSPVREKPNLLKGIDSVQREDGGNDSNVIDETMFVENVIPSDNQSQKKLRLGRNKKLSLKKVSKANRHPEGNLSDEQISLPQANTSFNSPGYKESKIASPPRKKIALDNFDVLPKKNKKNTSPTYAFKGSPVRKKAERALLNGWSCLECQKYYEAIGLSEEELQKRKNQCSRHRSKFNEKKASQKDYWDPDFSSSYHSTMWSED